MKTSVWTCNIAVYRASAARTASKLASAARTPTPQAPRPAPVRWYGGRDPRRDFIACAGFMARVIIATGLVCFIVRHS